MLLLARKAGQSVVIDGNIRVTVDRIRGRVVRLKVEAPREIRVDREEVWNRRASENQSGANEAIPHASDCGVGKSILLATQTLPLESRARPQTPMPARKDSTLDGSLAGKRTTVSDAELATQTRSSSSMTMSKGDSNQQLSRWPVLDAAAEEE